MGEYCEHIWYSNSGEFEVSNDCSTQITLCDSWKTEVNLGKKLSCN